LFGDYHQFASLALL